MRRTANISICLWLICSIILLAGCSSETERVKDPEKELTFGFSGTIRTLDTQFITDLVSEQAANLYTGRLYRYNGEGKLVPDLARRCDVSDDGLTWICYLRDDIVWSNGKKITADDFLFMYQRLADPQFGSPSAYYITSYCKIKNANEINKGEKDISELGVTVLGPDTIRVKLEEPCPYFEALHSSPIFAPCNREFYYEHVEDYCKSPEDILSSGPFLIDKYEPMATQIHCTKNDLYPYADNIRLEGITGFTVSNLQQGAMCFENGEIDVVPIDGEVLEWYKDDPRLVPLVKGCTYYMMFNFSNEKLQNINIRQALSKSIDRDSIVNTFLRSTGESLYRFVPAGYYQHLSYADQAEAEKEFKEINGYDPDKARELWEKGLSELGISKLKIEISVFSNYINLFEAMEKQMENTLQGLDIVIVPIASKQISVKKNSGDYEMLFYAWVTDYPDPSGFLYLMDEGQNPEGVGYSNQEYNELLDESLQGEAITNPEFRDKILLEAERTITKDIGYLPIYSFAEAYMVDDSIKFVKADPSGTRLPLQYVEKGEQP